MINCSISKNEYFLKNIYLEYFQIYKLTLKRKTVSTGSFIKKMEKNLRKKKKKKKKGKKDVEEERASVRTAKWVLWARNCCSQFFEQ